MWTPETIYNLDGCNGNDNSDQIGRAWKSRIFHPGLKIANGAHGHFMTKNQIHASRVIQTLRMTGCSLAAFLARAPGTKYVKNAKLLQQNA